MQKALRFHQPSALGFVFVVTLAILLMASVFVVMGVTELLGVDSEGVADPFRFVERLF